MESKVILNSISIGGAFFVGLVVFWFVFVHLKKRLTPDQPIQGNYSQTKTSWDEKRRHPRLDIAWPASFENSQGQQDVHLKDISLGGAFVICQSPMALQDQFAITIILPDHGPLQLNAEVVWSNINMPEDKVVNRGMGIRFIKNGQEARQKLQAAIGAAFEESSASV